MKKPPLEIIQTGSPLDFELSELLGEGAGQFLIIHADDKIVPWMGTPWATGSNRAEYEIMCEALNSRGDDSPWPGVFNSRKDEFRQLFGLKKAGLTHKNFHPHFSIKVAHVVTGYTTNLHVAIRLFEQLKDKIDSWEIREDQFGALVSFRSSQGKDYNQANESLPVAIATAVKALLLDLRQSTTHAQQP